MGHYDWITVGVDGSRGSRAAIAWAAREAARRDVGLRLVHVYQAPLPMGGRFAPAHESARKIGRDVAQQVVDEAVGQARRRLRADRIETEVLRCDRRTGLVGAAADAGLLVLGDEPHPSLDRLVTGSVVASVAAHAPTPVVVVPASWQEDLRRGVIVVGVKNAETSAGLVRHAFGLAAAHGARLRLLHAWEFLAQYDDAIAAHADLPAWERRAEAGLQGLLERAAPDFPGVAAEVRVVHGQPARVLVDASAEADLLVITRRPHGLPFGHLGGTGRAVLRETQCPVVVLPPAAEPVDVTGSATQASLSRTPHPVPL